MIGSHAYAHISLTNGTLSFLAWLDCQRWYTHFLGIRVLMEIRKPLWTMDDPPRLLGRYQLYHVSCDNNEAALLSKKRN